SGCDLLDVADPAPAVEACTHFVETFCTSPAACGQSATACQAAQLAGGLDCTKAIGLDSAFDACDADVKVLGCGDPLPPSCAGKDALRHAPRCDVDDIGADHRRER